MLILKWLITVILCRSETSPPPELPTQPPQPTVIPGMDSLTGDLLDLDLGPPMYQQPHAVSPHQMHPTPSDSTAILDLLGDGVDSLVSVEN